MKQRLQMTSGEQERVKKFVINLSLQIL